MLSIQSASSDPISSRLQASEPAERSVSVSLPVTNKFIINLLDISEYIITFINGRQLLSVLPSERSPKSFTKKKNLNFYVSY
jgi:hypothetical protein